MKFSNLTFPHPVLGLGKDDILGRIELGNPEINSLQDYYKIKVKLKYENPDLKQLIKDNKAEFLCEVSCSNTLYRELFKNDKGKIEFQIPKKDVKGRVEFICLLVTKDNLIDYSNSKAHPDYKNYTFELDQGDVLAYFGEFSFNADIKYEKLKAVSSFMEIVENQDLKYTYVDLKKDKIEIQLPTETYNIYRSDIISQEVKFSPIFHASIVLNALLTALYNFEEHKEYLWAKVIEYRLENDKELKDKNFDDKENVPEIAQILLGNPFRRLLEGMNVIVESQNEE